MATAKLLHREGTSLPEGGRRLFAAPARRRSPASPVMAAPAVALSFSPLVDFVPIWFLSQRVRLPLSRKWRPIEMFLELPWSRLV